MGNGVSSGKALGRGLGGVFGVLGQHLAPYQKPSKNLGFSTVFEGFWVSQKGLGRVLGALGGDFWGCGALLGALGWVLWALGGSWRGLGVSWGGLGAVLGRPKGHG